MEQKPPLPIEPLFVPVWKREFSYRGSQYRLLDQQNGIMGRLKIRLISSRCLGKLERGYLSPIVGQDNIRPYVIFSVESFEECSVCSSTSLTSGGCEFTWKEEKLELPIPKETFHAGNPHLLSLQVCNTEGVVKALVPRRVKGSNLLGQGAVALNPLLHSEVAMMETRVALDNGQGEVHIILEYSPAGMDPQIGDIVAFESFARHPSSIAVRSGEPFRCLESNANWLLVESTAGKPRRSEGRTGTGRRAMLRVHRNTIYVIERLGWTDGVYSVLMKPGDAIQRTKRGRWLLRKAAPIFQTAHQMLGPAYATVSVLTGTAKILLRSTLGGLVAALKGAWGANST